MEPPRPPAHVDACARGRWSIVTHARGADTDHVVAPYRCRSWRHAGACERAAGATDFRRIADAMRGRHGWVACLLTLDRRGRDLGHAWAEITPRWRDGVRRTLARRYGVIQHVAIVEQHRSGWPHLHVALRSVDGALARDLAARGWGWTDWYRADGIGPAYRPRWEREVWQSAALGAGFGPVAGATPVTDPTGLAGYLVKLAAELAASASKRQTPTHAPPRMRRLRSSVGLLPPRHSSRTPGRTGQIVAAPADDVRAAVSAGGIPAARSLARELAAEAAPRGTARHARERAIVRSAAQQRRAEHELLEFLEEIPP